MQSARRVLLIDSGDFASIPTTIRATADVADDYDFPAISGAVMIARPQIALPLSTLIAF